MMISFFLRNEPKKENYEEEGGIISSAVGGCLECGAFSELVFSLMGAPVTFWSDSGVKQLLVDGNEGNCRVGG